MDSTPAISICIPAYKNTNYLKRLLDSIAEQTFTDYEVVVTDDSPDDTVKDFLQHYDKIKSIKHFKNSPALGTPENWNEGIRRARGTWIKLMHDDDWFTHANALQVFYNTAQQNPYCKFFFSGFQNVTQETGEVEVVKCSFLDLLILKHSPLNLFKKVYIGNPSCTFIRRDVGLFYDKDFKFVVDFEYYIRLIQRFGKYRYIDNVLLNIGFNKEQVTKYTFLVPAVQIPENLLLLNKLGVQILRNVLVYDYYWRMFRNLKVRSVAEVRKYYEGTIPSVIINLLSFQTKVPLSILKIGLLSKILMACSYVGSLFISPSK